MICPILSAISSALTIAGWARAYRRASARAKAAEERAAKAEQERGGALYRCGILRGARDVAIDDRDAARSAHASALADIAEARRMAGAPDTATPQDIARELLARRRDIDEARALAGASDRATPAGIVEAYRSQIAALKLEWQAGRDALCTENDRLRDQVETLTVKASARY